MNEVNLCADVPLRNYSLICMKLISQSGRFGNGPRKKAPKRTSGAARGIESNCKMQENLQAMLGEFTLLPTPQNHYGGEGADAHP